MRAEQSWMSQAVRTCASSAAAYEAALLLAVDAKLEQALIESCRARYTLLERLLVALGHDGADAGTLRAVLPKASASRSPYQCLNDALAAARRLDGQLTKLIERAGCYVWTGVVGAGDRACAP